VDVVTQRQQLLDQGTDVFALVVGRDDDEDGPVSMDAPPPGWKQRF
jgi:hypothetical protein